MSRLIVKNLPNGIKEERFRNLFAAFGTLTDCCLKFTKDGKFRKFGFIGFQSEEDAKTAQSHFNKSFIDTSRVTVEVCKSFGDPSKPKAWSKHSSKPQLVKEASKKPTTNSDHAEKKQDGTKKKKKAGQLKELEGEAAFQDFLAAHQKRSQVATWSNDTKVEERAEVVEDYLNFDSDEDSSEETDAEVARKKGESSPSKAATQQQLSDMDYLRSKVVKGDESSPSSAEESEAEEMDSEASDGGEEEEVEEKTSLKPRAVSNTKTKLTGKISVQNLTEDTKGTKMTSQENRSAAASEPTTAFTVKMRGAPFNVTEQNVKEFFVPLRPLAIRIARNAHGNKTGYVFVDFNTEEEQQKALKRDREYMGGRYIELFPEERGTKGKPSEKGSGQIWQRTKKDDEEEEDLSESGRLFVRNLPYTCTEEEMEALFSKYGPLSEIHFPIDSLTKRPKGFAFVTYMFPEHAVKAFAEVDGQVFQGRMLHVLPSTIKKEEAESSASAGSSSYKKQKASKDKANSLSSHNWNTLFMGTNAVADAVAHKYNATKSQVLDHEGKGSVAVRVALGETELVQNVRRFLLDHGVSLDSFSQAAGERSKAVILVKNLPAGTKAKELEEVFGPFGSLGRVLLPEGGVTAIVEFLEPTEAKKAFTKLAYSKFQHIPLYLEWAPMGVFSGPGTKMSEVEEQKESEEQTQKGIFGKSDALKEMKEEEEEEEEEEEKEEESLPGCTIFIKNLNFSTTEDTLKEVFSKAGVVRSCTVSKKKDKTGNLLSMGFGFVEYKKPEYAQKAVKQLQGCSVDGHQLEVKISERAIKSTGTTARKKQVSKKQVNSKILVRNIPFQATVKEIRELFSTFGELKTVRLPKKMFGSGTHRGFGFVDFLTKQDAKRAFGALCHSTHLYGRRLVLEWADSEETVEALRRKTAEHFHDPPVKKQKTAMLEEILEKLEDDEGENEENT
ncbi:probable RNA-binding protein 19 [Pseudonaja textilis]|uniref:probable RNA-binding protein 19 n=1 Tax=Pseudonaja textilis TaxID=8673 RepID=UPI000EA99CC6|nr:probable RNA-binding protein 19 [Pseudonaja textilis]